MFLAVEAVLFGLYLLLGVPAAYAEEYRIVAASDGGVTTIKSVMDGSAKVRLYGIGALKVREHYGQADKELVDDTALFKEADV